MRYKPACELEVRKIKRQENWSINDIEQSDIPRSIRLPLHTVMQTESCWPSRSSRVSMLETSFPHDDFMMAEPLLRQFQLV